MKQKINQETTTRGGYIEPDDLWFSNSCRIITPPKKVGYWTYANNREEAKTNPTISVYLTKAPTWRTSLLMRLFNIYWIKTEE